MFNVIFVKNIHINVAITDMGIESAIINVERISLKNSQRTMIENRAPYNRDCLTPSIACLILVA
jgi:hypothetical protein